MRSERIVEIVLICLPTIALALPPAAVIVGLARLRRKPDQEGFVLYPLIFVVERSALLSALLVAVVAHHQTQLWVGLSAFSVALYLARRYVTTREEHTA